MKKNKTLLGIVCVPEKADYSFSGDNDWGESALGKAAGRHTIVIQMNRIVSIRGNGPALAGPINIIF